MADIDVEGALLKLDLLLDRTANESAKADLQAARTVICQLRQAQLASYAAVQSLDKAIDVGSDRKRPLLATIRTATRAPEGTELELLEYVAQWSEMIAAATAQEAQTA